MPEKVYFCGQGKSAMLGRVVKAFSAALRRSLSGASVPGTSLTESGAIDELIRMGAEDPASIHAVLRRHTVYENDPACWDYAQSIGESLARQRGLLGNGMSSGVFGDCAAYSVAVSALLMRLFGSPGEWVLVGNDQDPAQHILNDVGTLAIGYSGPVYLDATDARGFPWQPPTGVTVMTWLDPMTGRELLRWRKEEDMEPSVTMARGRKMGVGCGLCLLGIAGLPRREAEVNGVSGLFSWVQDAIWDNVKPVRGVVEGIDDFFQDTVIDEVAKPLGKDLAQITKQVADGMGKVGQQVVDFARDPESWKMMLINTVSFAGGAAGSFLGFANTARHLSKYPAINAVVHGVLNAIPGAGTLMSGAMTLMQGVMSAGAQRKRVYSDGEMAMMAAVRDQANAMVPSGTAGMTAEIANGLAEAVNSITDPSHRARINAIAQGLRSGELAFGPNWTIVPATSTGPSGTGFLGDIFGAIGDAASWTVGAVSDAGSWVGGAATDAWGYVFGGGTPATSGDVVNTIVNNTAGNVGNTVSGAVGSVLGDTAGGFVGSVVEVGLAVGGNTLAGGGSASSALNGATYAQCSLLPQNMMCGRRKDGKQGCADPCAHLPGAPDPGAALALNTQSATSALAGLFGFDQFMLTPQYRPTAEQTTGNTEYLFESGGPVISRTDLDALVRPQDVRGPTHVHLNLMDAMVRVPNVAGVDLLKYGVEFKQDSLGKPWHLFKPDDPKLVRLQWLLQTIERWNSEHTSNPIPNDTVIEVLDLTPAIEAWERDRTQGASAAFVPPAFAVIDSFTLGWVRINLQRSWTITTDVARYPDGNPPASYFGFGRKPVRDSLPGLSDGSDTGTRDGKMLSSDSSRLEATAIFVRPWHLAGQAGSLPTGDAWVARWSGTRSTWPSSPMTLEEIAESNLAATAWVKLISNSGSDIIHGKPWVQVGTLRSRLSAIDAQLAQEEAARQANAPQAAAQELAKRRMTHMAAKWRRTDDNSNELRTLGEWVQDFQNQYGAGANAGMESLISLRWEEDSEANFWLPMLVTLARMKHGKSDGTLFTTGELLNPAPLQEPTTFSPYEFSDVSDANTVTGSGHAVTVRNPGSTGGKSGGGTSHVPPGAEQPSNTNHGALAPTANSGMAVVVAITAATVLFFMLKR